MASPRRIPKTKSAYSLATRDLIERLSRLTIGEVVTYKELNQLIGGDVQGAQRHLLLKAIDYVWEELKIGLDTLTDIGLQRLSEAEKLGHTRRRLHIGHTYFAKTGRRLATTDFTQLSPLHKHMALGQMSVIGMVTLGTAEPTLRQLEAQPTPQPIQIDPREYLGLFQGL